MLGFGLVVSDCDRPCFKLHVPNIAFVDPPVQLMLSHLAVLAFVAADVHEDKGSVVEYVNMLNCNVHTSPLYVDVNSFCCRQ